MLISLLIFLLVSNAVTIKQDKSILFSRVAITGLICSSYIAFNNLHVQGLEKGIGIYGGLFNITTFTQTFNIFIFIVSAVILTLTAFYPRKVYVKDYSSLYKILTFSFIYNKNIISNKTGEQFRIIEYALITVFILCGAVFLISTGDLISIFLSIELQSYGLYVLSTLYRDSEYAFKENVRYLLTCLGISICIYISIKIPHICLFNTFDVMYLTPLLAGFCGLVSMTFKTNFFKDRAPTKGEFILSSILPMVFTVLFMYLTDKCLDTTVTLIQDGITVFLTSEIGLTLCMDNTGSAGGSASGNVNSTTSGAASGNVNSTTSVSGSQSTASNTGPPVLAFGYNNFQWRNITLHLEYSIFDIINSRTNRSHNVRFGEALRNSDLTLPESEAVRAYYRSVFGNTHYRGAIWGSKVGRRHITAMNRLGRSANQAPNSSDESDSSND